MIPRSVTGPVDELAAVLTDLRARVATVEVVAHRHVFSLEPTAWVAPSFSNGWANAAGVQAVQYRRVGDEVQLRGVMASGTVGAAAFTLPAGFRPPATLYLACSSNNVYGQMTVTNAGVVTPTVGSNVWFAVVGRFSTTT
jgi:hypothetical protein